MGTDQLEEMADDQLKTMVAVLQGKLSAVQKVLEQA
jgi:hypothetical protein